MRRKPIQSIRHIRFPRVIPPGKDRQVAEFQFGFVYGAEVFEYEFHGGVSVVWSG